MDKRDPSDKPVLLITDAPDAGTLRRFMDYVRNEPAPVLAEPEHPYEFLPVEYLRIDWAKPGSDRTGVALLAPPGHRPGRMLSVQRFDPPVTVFSRETLAEARRRLLMFRGRKSQKATARRIRFERNKAQRLEAARHARAGQFLPLGRRAGLNTLVAPLNQALLDNWKRELMRRVGVPRGEQGA